MGKKTRVTTKPDQPSKQMYMYGIKNYLPAPQEGEDEGTIGEHIKMLQSESKKRRQDSTLINHLMSVTLSHRRHGIINKQWTVPYLKTVFPCLFDEDEVSSS